MFKTVIPVAIAIAVLSHTTEAHAAAQTPAPCGVDGTARDATGLPLPGVTVAVLATGIRAVTDTQGRYCLPKPPTGRVTVRLTLKGFEIEDRHIEMSPSGAPLTLDVTLRLSSFFNEEVVTATRTSRRLDDVPVRTEVVSLASM